MRLDSKIGIVTAAGSGMGRAGALRFAREGAAVGVVDIDQAGVDAVVGEITAAGGRALGLLGDLRRDDFARDIVRRTANAFGGLDFVWNHVGHPGPASIEGLDMADFEIAIDLNLRTVLVTTEAAIPEIRARGGGALLYTASTSGLQGSGFSPVYSMAKFGVVGFVRALAKRLAPDHIRVNAVCPGPIETPMLRVFVALWKSKHGTVVCSIDTGEFTEDYPEAEWSYLKAGAIIRTAAGELFHCTEADEYFELIARGKAPQSS